MDRERHVETQHADVGVAVAIPGGLITPIIRAAETKTLSVISREMKDFSARARARKLLPEDYQAARRRCPTSACSASRAFPPSSIHRKRRSSRSAPRSARYCQEWRARHRNRDERDAVLRSPRCRRRFGRGASRHVQGFDRTTGGDACVKIESGGYFPHPLWRGEKRGTDG